MLFSSAAVDARRILFAFHFELSRIARRSPSRLFGRGAIGVFADSTMPRGSKTSTEFESITFINIFCFLRSSSKSARAVGASIVHRTCGRIDRLEHRRAHVAPAGNESREAPGMSAHDKEVDVVGRGYDRNPRVRIALHPLRQGAVGDFAVAMVSGDQA